MALRKHTIENMKRKETSQGDTRNRARKCAKQPKQGRSSISIIVSHPFGDALQALVSKLRELLVEGRPFLQGLPGAALVPAAVESLFENS